MKIKIEELVSELNGFDCGCARVKNGDSRRYKNLIYFHQDDPDKGWLNLRLTKFFVTVEKGKDLTSDEAIKFWALKDYDFIENLAEDISQFSNNYFSSFITVRR